MAIVLEDQTDEQFSGNGSTTEFNMSHTVSSGSNLFLLVLISWLNDDNEAVSTVYWDPEGVNEQLTKIASYNTADDSRVEAYYKIGPTAGSSKNVEVIFDSAPLGTSTQVVSAYSLSGAQQSSQPRDEDGEGQDTSATITATLTSAQSGDFIAGCNVIESGETGDFDSSTITMTTVFTGGTLSGVKHLHGYGSADGSGETIVCTWTSADHTAGMAVAIAQAVSITYEISGVTKDSDGVALGSCHCYLCKDNGDDTASFIEYQLSHASTGAYSFTGLEDNDPNYFVIARKSLAPWVFDVTDYVLTPQEE